MKPHPPCPLLVKEVLLLLDSYFLKSNELSHDYDGLKFEQSEHIIKIQILHALEKLHQFFTQEFSNN